MFFHDKRLQFEARPERPDPLLAKKFQEVLGGQWSEMSAMVMYLFQGMNCRGPAKYRDMLLDTATEELAHIEMLGTLICRLLEGASAEDQEAAAKGGGVVAAILGGTSPKDMVMAAAMNPQHLLTSGLGAMPADSVGNRWTAKYVTATGNLLADFRLDLTAETMGRLHFCRLYEQTNDRGVQDLLSFLIARDTMHQNQFLAAIADLEKEGLEGTPCPIAFPRERENQQVNYQFWNLSGGTESAEGRWASGPSIDGTGRFQYVAAPQPLGPVPDLRPVDPQVYGTMNPPAGAPR